MPLSASDVAGHKMTRICSHSALPSPIKVSSGVRVMSTGLGDPNRMSFSLLTSDWRPAGKSVLKCKASLFVGIVKFHLKLRKREPRQMTTFHPARVTGPALILSLSSLLAAIIGLRVSIIPHVI